jgi:hypothetical protein
MAGHGARGIHDDAAVVAPLEIERLYQGIGVYAAHPHQYAGGDTIARLDVDVIRGRDLAVAEARSASRGVKLRL